MSRYHGKRRVLYEGSTLTALLSSERSVFEVETAGTAVEAAAGLAVVVLSIIGLARSDSAFMTSIAGIVLGAALLAQGGTVAAEFSKLLTMTTGGTVGAVELSAGMTIEVLGGGAAIVLGILGLVGLAPDVLLACAVIAVGGSRILAASGYQRLNTLKAQAAGLPEMAQKVAQGAVAGAVAAQVLAGAAAVVLGILALAVTSHGPLLTLVGLLVLGAGAAPLTKGRRRL
jgi:hypothetical protein